MGRIFRTRGRIGEFICEIDSSHPGRAELIQHVLLRKPPREAEFDVTRLWYHSGRPIFQFSGIDSISAAEPWEGAEILVSAAEKVAPEPDEYFHDDLIGCTVEDATSVLGTIVAVHEYGSHPTLELTTSAGRELLIPFVKAYLRGIDIPGKHIKVELPEGLTDL